MSTFNVDAFLGDLNKSTKSSGSTKLWRLNMTKVEEHQVDIMRLPMQAKVVIRAIVMECRANADANFAFSVPMVAEWSKKHNLDTKQEAERIVRYYWKQVKSYVVDPA
jgi:hypothetical protein